MKGKLANGVGSQYSHTTSERGVSSITNGDAHTSAASSRLNCRPRRFKWIRPFRRKTKSGVCACAITFQTQSVYLLVAERNRLFNSLLNLTLYFTALTVYCMYLQLNSTDSLTTRWFKYDRDLFVCKQAALRSSCATLRE